MKSAGTDSIFKARMQDLCRRQRDKNIWMASGFLDPAQQLEALGISRKEGARGILWGGYEDAERKMLFLLPDYLEWEDALAGQEAIAALSISTKQAGLSHRDYLGAILAAGIERRCLGDILVKERGAVFFCEKKIAPYLMDNLLSVGKASVSLGEATPCEFENIEADAQELRINVASLRLDVVLAAGFSLSRGKVQEWIEGGYVNVNFVPCLQAGKALAEGDVISLRRHGRIELLALEGESRKGRLFVKIARKSRGK